MTEFRKECERILDVMSLDDEYSLQNADSMTRVEIIMAAEAIIGAELTNSEILSLKTYGDLESFIKAKKK